MYAPCPMARKILTQRVAVLVVTLLLTVFSMGAASAASGGAGDAGMMVRRVGAFTPSDFDFKVIVEDDGKDEAGA